MPVKSKKRDIHESYFKLLTLVNHREVLFGGGAGFSDYRSYNISIIHYMKKESLKINDQPKAISTKHKKRKQFIVDANRLQFDEYMLGQIKKNGHSLKKLKKEVVELKWEVKKLHDCRDDYLIFQKSKTQDRSTSSRSQAHLTKFQRKVFVPASHQHHNYNSIPYAKSKQSSIMSKSSCSSSKKCKSANKKGSSQSNISKSRLATKIKQLKEKARIQSTQKRIIKLEVEKKIEKIVEQEVKVEDKNTPPTPKDNIFREPENQVGYQQLLQLLKTNKSISSRTQLNFTPQSVQVTQFQSEKRDKESSCLKVEQNQKIQSQKTMQSTVNFQGKSSNAFAHSIYQQQRSRQIQERIGSETNLLQSSPSVDTPRKTKKALQLSRCIEVKIVNENNSSEQGSGYDGLFVGNHFRSGTLDLSFEGRDNSKRRLRELQFEFDQLVRQQLLSADAREKQLLSKTIRSVLNSITDLKQKISREAR